MTYEEDLEELKKEERIRQRLSMFKGASLYEVRIAVSKLDDIHKKIFRRVNPLNGSEADSLMVIARDFNMTFGRVMRTNNEAIEQIRGFLKDICNEKSTNVKGRSVIGADVVTCVLKPKEKSVVESAPKTESTTKSIDLGQETHTNIEARPSYGERVLGNKKEVIEKVAHSIDDMYARVFLLSYPLDGSKPKNSKEISEMLGITEQVVNYYKHRSYEMVSKILNGTMEMPTKRTMFSHVELEKIQSAVAILTDIQRKVFLSVHPINGDIAKTYTEIARETGYTRGNIENIYLIALGKIRDYLAKVEGLSEFGKTEEEEIKDRIGNIVSMVGAKNIDEVKEASKYVTPKYRSVFVLRYPLDGSKPCTYSEIAIKLNLTQSSLPGYENRAVSELKEYIKTGYIFRKAKKEKPELNGNDKEKIKRIFRLLGNKVEEAVIMMRLGFIGDKYYTKEEIAATLRLSLQEVEEIMNRIKIKLSLIDNEFGRQVNMIYDSIEDKVK